MAGGAVTYSSRALREQVLDVAADLLEAPREDLVIDDGDIHVAGVPSISVSYADVAAARPDETLRSDFAFDGGEGGWAQATHVCWVEVDLTTGRVHIDRYVAVEDCGELINPNVVDGQVSGGVVQGIGAVLYERSVYDDQANFQAGTFMDYLLPTAAEVPEIEIHHVETPSDLEVNYRGVGEGGMIVAPAALTNAIEDALAHLGVRITEQHLPPARILELAGVIATRRVIPFVDWLARQTRRRDAVGDLARDTRRDATWPPGGKVNRAKLRAHLEAHEAIPGALDALDAAWDEWDGLRREERDA